MHCPVSSDHIISEHIRPVHAEHDLRPFERQGRVQPVGNPGKSRAESRAAVLEAPRWGADREWGGRGDPPPHTRGFCHPGFRRRAESGSWPVLADALHKMLIPLSTDPGSQQASRCDWVGSGPGTSFSEGASDSGQRGGFWEGWCAVWSRRTEGKQKPAHPSSGILSSQCSQRAVLPPGGPEENSLRSGPLWWRQEVGRSPPTGSAPGAGEGLSEIVTAFPKVSPPK